MKHLGNWEEIFFSGNAPMRSGAPSDGRKISRTSLYSKLRTTRSQVDRPKKFELYEVNHVYFDQTDQKKIFE